MGILLRIDRHRPGPRRAGAPRPAGPAELVFFTGIRYERGTDLDPTAPDRIDLAARLSDPDRGPRGAGRRRKRPA